MSTTTATRHDEIRAEWKEIQTSMRHGVQDMLRRQEVWDMTALDQSADELERYASRVRELVERGSDAMHRAAVALAEAAVDPAKVHGELVFDPRPLEDFMIDLPIGGEWHPRGQMEMTLTTLPVVVPRPNDTDTYPGEVKLGTADWRASCRDAINAALNYHRYLGWENLLPEDPEPLEAEVAA